jgi:hypothetical protein
MRGEATFEFWGNGRIVIKEESSGKPPGPSIEEHHYE